MLSGGIAEKTNKQTNKKQKQKQKQTNKQTKNRNVGIPLGHLCVKRVISGQSTPMVKGSMGIYFIWYIGPTAFSYGRALIVC